MQITKLDVTHLAEKSVFLQERMNDSVSKFTFTNDYEQEQLQRLYKLWQKKAGGNGGKQAFLKRLSLENMSEEQAEQLLRPVKWNEDAPLPKWVLEIEQIVSVLPATRNDLLEKIVYKPEQEILNEIKVYDALLPFIIYCEKQLLITLGDDRKLFQDSAIVHVLSQITKQLDQLIFRTSLHEFELDRTKKNPLYRIMGHVISNEKRQEEWSDFQKQLLAGKWFEMIMKYPVLARIMMKMIQNWLNYMTQFTSHMKRDKQLLGRIFNEGKPLGLITSIQADVSDLHNKGKSVFILTFKSGTKIVYKPRSLKIDIAWTKWVRYLEENDMPYRLKTPKVIDRQEYGWMEFITYNEVEKREDAHTFFFRSGVLLGTIYAFGGNDYHYENIIACGAHPVLVDTETLLLNKVKPFRDELKSTATFKVEEELMESVARVGMLPWWRKDTKGEAFEFGALTNKRKGNMNLPAFQGEMLNVHEYENDLVDGLNWIFSFLMKHKHELCTKESVIDQLFGECHFRYVIRNTQTYANILHHTTKPNFLKDGMLYSLEMERIAPAYLLHSPDESLQDLWNIFISERNALEDRDIPIFYGEANKLTIHDPIRPLYDRYFMESAIDNCKNLISRLDEKKQKFQIQITKTLLALHRLHAHESNRLEKNEHRAGQQLRVTDELLLTEAINIYNEMMETRVIGASGDFNWYTFKFDLETEKVNIGSLSYHLYDGAFGIGTFIAALYQLTKREDMKESALTIVAPFREMIYDTYNPFPVQRMPIGLGNGIASLIRGLMLMGNYLNDQSFWGDAIYIARSVTLEQINRNKHANVLNGTAGLLTVFVDLYKQTGDEKILQLATYCGQQMLRKRIKMKSGHHVWNDQKYKNPLTGMGHGIAGIASSLYKLGMFIEKDEYKEAALEAMEFEHLFYDSKATNWLDLRYVTSENDVQKSFMSGWCGGAPGIGLARIFMMELDEKIKENNFLQQDIAHALEFASMFSEEVTDHLCCGHAASVDFLIEASRMLQRESLLSKAREKMGMIIAHKQSKGHYSLLFPSNDQSDFVNYSLFQGTAGIGYEMLRIIKPNEIVSVLK